jgi:putative OPT family oligopeptide transporter
MAAPTANDLQATPAGAGPGVKPYVADQVRMPEFTWSAVILGTVLGILFGASSLYLMLKVGMTVSASIPVAVLSITLFRVFSRLGFVRKATILENNIVQTTGSAGESIAFGVGATMPALLLLGFEMDIGRVMVVAVLGGVLGILMMIPLRRAFIVEKHHELKYPEGTACAEVLIVGEKGGSSAKTVFIGFGIAFLYQFLWQGLNLWKEVVRWSLKRFKFPGASPALEVNPALLGVGYIIGPRIASIMVAGGVLATFVLIPAIRMFGDHLGETLLPGDKLISAMSDEEIGKIYVRYIGAGAVAAGGIISVFRALPLILSSIKAGVRDLRRSRAVAMGEESADVPRTERDLSLWVVGGGSLALVVALWATTPLHEKIPWVPDLHLNPLAAALIVLFGFLFVTVSSRLTGEIGSSSNPISGMTVATLLLTCLIFLALANIEVDGKPVLVIDHTTLLTALSIAAVVCVAASNGGTTSQDLKTGFLVGATPKWQQLAIVIGALSSALVIGYILVGLNNASTVYTKNKRNLPDLKAPLNLNDLRGYDRERAPGDDTLYYVWHAPDDNPQGVPRGKYLVDDQGHLRYLVDPGINGKISRRDDGSEVRKYNAPQAQLMYLVTSGILTQKLPWTLVFIGVSIAIVMELCGISALAFAVGVYLPLSTTAPAFAGGMVRYVSNRWAHPGPGGAASEVESDTSPGMLLSTGYIAGGTIAGVLIAFLNFSEDIPKKLNIWQYRHYTLSQTAPVADAWQEAARYDLGTAGATESERADVEATAAAIADLNEGLLQRNVTAPKGTLLKLPPIPKGLDVAQLQEKGSAPADPAQYHIWQAAAGNPEGAPPGKYLVDEEGRLRYFEPAEAVSLAVLAGQLLGTADKASLLFDLNDKVLQLPKTLPAGTDMKLPQHNNLALIAFGIIVLFLALVGLGWLLRPPQPPPVLPVNNDLVEHGPTELS